MPFFLAIIWLFSLAGLAEGQNVAVFLEFERAPDSSSLEAMKREAARLLAPSGLQLDFRGLAENRGTQAHEHLVVLRFRGRCDSPATPPETEGEMPAGKVTLGSTNVTDGRVLPFGEVECEPLRLSVSRFQWAHRGLIMGRALGRVLAHELYHMLAKTRGHGAHGMSKSTITWGELIAPRMSFSAGDILLLRTGGHSGGH